MKHMKDKVTLGLFMAIGTLLATPAQAQFNGSHTLGDFGVQAGTQPAPGFYAAAFYYRYSADSLKDRNGDTVALSPGSSGSLAIDAYVPILWYVSQHKVLGANYGAMAAFPWANGALEAPIFGLDQKRSENTGKGMWTYEPFVGATLYLDERKTFSLATNVYWEFHGSPSRRRSRSRA